jgi:hypothetical protein
LTLRSTVGAPIASNQDTKAAGLWCSPQIASTHDWLLPYPLSGDVGANPERATFGDDLELLGVALDPPAAASGDSVTVTLYWHAVQAVSYSETVFVHLLDGAGQVRSQHDGAPVSGTYPTNVWAPGDVVVDAHTLPLPADLAAGTYQIEVGFYDLATLQRLPARGADGTPLPGDRLLLGLPLMVAE